MDVAKDAAKGSDPLLDLVLEDAPAARCLVGPDGRVLRANAEWLRSMGVAPADLLGTEAGHLLPDARALARARAGRRVEVRRHPRRTNGVERWWEGSVVPVPLEGGTGVLVSLREVTGASPPVACGARPELVESLVRTLASVVESSGEFIGVCSLDLKGVYLNDAGRRMVGLCGRDVTRTHVLEYFWPADRPRIEAEAVPALLRDGHWSGEVCFRNFETGQPVHTMWNAFTIRDEGGAPVAYATVSPNLDALKRAEEARREEERKYRSLFEHSVDAVYVARDDGTVLDANRAACEMHGMTVEEIRRRGRAGLVVADERLAEALRRRAALGRTTAELTLVRADGTTFPAEVESVVVEPNRPDWSTFVIARDITERVRAQERLRERERKYAAMHDHAPFAIALSAHPEGTIVEVNAAWERMFGYTSEQAVGRSVEDLGLTVDAEGRARMFAEMTRAGSVQNWELEFATRTGERRLGAFSFALLDIGGRRFRLGTTTDVTERRRADDEIRASRQQLRELATRQDLVLEQEKTCIARELHDEMGQLLTALRLDVEAIEEGLAALPAEGPIPRLLDRAVDASELAAQSVLTMQRVVADLRPPALDRLGLCPALREEGRRFQQRTGVRCIVIAPQELQGFGADLDTALFRIAQEALTNVARHARAAEVLVVVEASDDEVVLRVEDDGRGIDGARVNSGSLGIVGMRERTERLGGELTVAPGGRRGTVVRARIPFAPSPGTRA